MRLVPLTEFASTAFQDRWRILAAACPVHDLGQTYAWNRCWWEFYEHQGSMRKRLFLLADEEEGQLRGIWPLFISERFGVRVIRWLGQCEGMITDYMLPLAPQKFRSDTVRAFVEFLGANASQWDVLDLTIPLWSQFLPSLVKAAVVYGTKPGLTWQSGIADHSAVADLPGSFEQYLLALGAKTRAHVKQYLRAGVQAGARLELQKGREILARLPDLFELNQGRWSVFTSERSRDFLREVAGQEGNGDALLQVALRLGERTLATALCFREQGTCFVHSAGVVRQTVAGFSPGTLMYALLIRSLIETGATRLDFSPGLEEYKLRLGANVEPVFRFTLRHAQSRNCRWQALNAYWAVRRSLKRSRLPLLGRAS